MRIISNRSISSYLSFRNIPHIANPNFHKLPRSALRDCHSAPFAGVSRWSGLDLWTELSPGAATKWKTRCGAASELRCKTSAKWVKTCQNQRVPMGSLFGSHQNSRDLIIFIPQSGHSNLPDDRHHPGRSAKSAAFRGWDFSWMARLLFFWMSSPLLPELVKRLKWLKPRKSDSVCAEFSWFYLKYP
jgi:hypothetical protein